MLPADTFDLEEEALRNVVYRTRVYRIYPTLEQKRIIDYTLRVIHEYKQKAIPIALNKVKEFLNGKPTLKIRGKIFVCPHPYEVIKKFNKKLCNCSALAYAWMELNNTIVRNNILLKGVSKYYNTKRLRYSFTVKAPKPEKFEKLKENLIYIPKLKYVQADVDGKIEPLGTPILMRVRKVAEWHYECHVIYEANDNVNTLRTIPKETGNYVAVVDVGLRTLATVLVYDLDTDRIVKVERYKYPWDIYKRQHEEISQYAKLVQEIKKSMKERGGMAILEHEMRIFRDYREALRRAQKLHKYVHNTLAKRILKYKYVILEPVYVKNLDHRCKRTYFNQRTGTFLEIIKHKAQLYRTPLYILCYGRDKIEKYGYVHYIPSSGNTSNICNVCGNKVSKLKFMHVYWKCPYCGTVHERDINACLNILDRFLELYNIEKLARRAKVSYRSTLRTEHTFSGGLWHETKVILNGDPDNVKEEASVVQFKTPNAPRKVYVLHKYVAPQRALRASQASPEVCDPSKNMREPKMISDCGVERLGLSYLYTRQTVRDNVIPFKKETQNNNNQNEEFYLPL